MADFPTGFLSWILAGVTAFATARFLKRHRRSWPAELAAALLAAFAAGLGATAFDFGGWQVLYPQAVVFAFAAAIAAIPLLRVARA